MTPQRMKEIAMNAYLRRLTIEECQELRAHAEQLERSGEWQTISTAPKPNDKPYAPLPDRRCDKCDMIQCVCGRADGSGGEMTQERQDGWYWVEYEERWMPEFIRWPDGVPQINGYGVFVAKIGSRIPSPDEPNAAPAYFEVVKAAKELVASVHWDQAIYTNSEFEALRSALANLKLEE